MCRVAVRVVPVLLLGMPSGCLQGVRETLFKQGMWVQAGSGSQAELPSPGHVLAERRPASSIHAQGRILSFFLSFLSEGANASRHSREPALGSSRLCGSTPRGVGAPCKCQYTPKTAQRGQRTLT